MANYQLELTGAEINQRLKNIGKETDEQSPSGSIYARIAQNQDDITNLGTEVAVNTESITTLKATVADHETGLGTLSDQIHNVQEKADKNTSSVEKLRTQMNTFAESVETLIDGVEEKAGINSDNIGKINDKLDTDVVSDVATTRDATKVVVKQTKRNIKTGATATTDVTLPAATTDNAGVMTADDKKTLGLLENRVTDVETATEDLGNSMENVRDGLTNVVDVDNQCFFSLENRAIYFTDNTNADLAFKLYRWTGMRYAEYILWDNETKKKVDYTFFSTDGELYIRLNAQNAITLAEFVKLYSTKRKKWGIVAFDTDTNLPLTSMFEFAVAKQSVLSITDLHEGEAKNEKLIVKTNGHRNTPRKEETRLAYYYDSKFWQSVGDKTNGFDYRAVYQNATSDRTYFLKFPCSGDIVRRIKNGNIVGEGNILCVDRKADGTFEMTWNEGKKVYSMAFSKYTYMDDSLGREYTGMRITKAATLICDDITNQTKGGTLRDLYIQAGAKYNEDTGYYELNGLTDITEEEMREIYLRTNNWWNALPDMRGWDDGGNCRTNIPCPRYVRLSYSAPWNLSQSFNGETKLEVVNLNPISPNKTFANRTLSSINYFLQGNGSTKKVIGILVVSNCPGEIWIGGKVLEDINLFGINKNVIFYQAKALSKESLLYMINNSTATSAITISLLQVLYDKYKADADVLAALAEHPFVSLALK